MPPARRRYAIPRRVGGMLAYGALLVGLASTSRGTLAAQEPYAWLITGQDADDYRLRRDEDVARTGEASMRLAARGNRRNSQWAVSVQMVDATAYRGKRIRLAGYVKGDELRSGGLWLRVDGILDGSYAMLALDNTEDRRVEGTQDWTETEIVVDVPPESVTILFGAMINGDGTVWVDDLVLEEAPDAEPTSEAEVQRTDSPYARPPGVFGVPTNLDFETVPGGS